MSRKVNPPAPTPKVGQLWKSRYDKRRVRVLEVVKTAAGDVVAVTVRIIGGVHDQHTYQAAAWLAFSRRAAPVEE